MPSTLYYLLIYISMLDDIVFEFYIHFNAIGRRFVHLHNSKRIRKLLWITKN